MSGTARRARPDSSRCGKQQGEAQAPVEQFGIFVMVFAGVATGQRGQQDGAERCAQHAGGNSIRRSACV